MYDVQAVLKRDHCSALDKYKMKGSGTTRWKVAVGVSALQSCWWRCGAALLWMSVLSLLQALGPVVVCGAFLCSPAGARALLSRVANPLAFATAPPPAVGLLQEVLREQSGIFEQAGRTPTGKIIWQLKAAA